MKKEPQLVDVDEKLVDKIVIHRIKDGGFQRKLRQGRPGRISDSVKNGSIIPPITIARVGDKLLLVDGQHRLEAWKLSAFPLKAVIHHMDSEGDAVKAFIDMNREQVRVSRNHVINISPEDVAVRTRELAERCKVTNGHIFNLIAGIANVKDPFKAEITETHWKLAAKTMAFWMNQKRWGREDNLFSSVGTLMMVGYFVGKSTNAESILKDLVRLDYTRAGRLGKICGTSWALQREMRAIVYKALAEQVL